MKQFEDEKVKWEQQRQAAAQAGKAFDDAEPTMDEERERAWQVKKQEQRTSLQYVATCLREGREGKRGHGKGNAKCSVIGRRHQHLKNGRFM